MRKRSPEVEKLIRRRKLHAVGWCSFEPNSGHPFPHNVSNDVKKHARWPTSRRLMLWHSLSLFKVTPEFPGDWMLVFLMDEMNA
jgi:hypothetical protein